nr:unnamed protein product [Haemonchus contortus]
MKLESLHAEFHGEAQNANLEKLRQLEEAMGAIDILVGQLEATLSRFLTLRDSSVTGAEPDDNETYSIRAEEGIAAAVEYMMLLQARIRAIKSCDGMSQSQVTAPQPKPGMQAQLRKIQREYLGLGQLLGAVQCKCALTGSPGTLQIQLPFGRASRRSQRIHSEISGH